MGFSPGQIGEKSQHSAGTKIKYLEINVLQVWHGLCISLGIAAGWSGGEQDTKETHHVPL